MAQHYSTKDFFRRTPNQLLARYFLDRGHFAELNISKMKETKIQALFDAWLDGIVTLSALTSNASSV